MLFVLISIPFKTHAGLFSFITDLFDGNQFPKVEVVEKNAQNIPLLQAALNLDPNPAKGGGDITIVGGTALLPESGPSGTIADVEENPTSDEISIYVVREGDSLSTIAKIFNVSTNTIRWSNDIPTNGAIKPGQTLVILPISGVQHVVKTGDTIETIVKKYRADKNEVLQYNNLKPNAVLAVGETLIIPDGEMVAIHPASAGAKASSAKKVKGSNAPYYQGYYMRPIAGGHKSQGLHGYNGVDLADSYGTPVMAAAGGEVIVSRMGGWNAGYGNYVVIAHENGTQTLYGHLAQNIVSEGQVVSKGQLIGLMGSTGNSTGPHVHFEIRGAKNPF
ncbi:M23 family metallopeptidase [Patescibacteria group bacterium]|nr:MAG: M23 family metallopeptidase [Patescibacteria group bacterium]